MHSIRQSCQSALRSSNNACAYTIGSRRAFSRSTARSRGALPVFLESSTPELSSLLSETNSKILLPSHLTKEQQKLVYKQENKAKLEAEPVEITLGDVTLALEHLDRNRLPNRWATFKDIVAKSETREDWENVVRVLEGFESAGIKLSTDKQAMVVRRLNIEGMHHIILKALQRVKATGLRMREWRVLLQVLRAPYDKAALADWDEEETTKALRFAKQVAELLEDEEHCGGQVAEHDFRGKPAVIAVPTALAAVLAHKHSGDVQEVKTLAGRLVAALKQDDYTTTLDAIAEEATRTEADFQSKPKQASFVTSLNAKLLELVFIQNALNTSMKVLKEDMPAAEEAKQYASKTSQVLADGLATVKKLRTKGGDNFMGGLVDHVANIAAKSDI